MYDVSQIANELVEVGGKVFTQKVSEADFMQDFEFMRDVKTPQVLPKMTIVGGPRPYRKDVDVSGNGVEFTDRILRVNQSKWDFPSIDVEVFRNKYLAKVKSRAFDPAVVTFSIFVAQEMVKNYLAKINDEVVWAGDYNASGTTTAAIATGFGTIIADEIAAENLSPIVTGAITSTNAVEKFELMYGNLPNYFKNSELILNCSHSQFENYRKDYRSKFNFQFDKNEMGEYVLDGTKCVVKPRSWMGNSERLVIVPKEEKNFHFGVDGDSIKTYATPDRNLINVRMMFALGMQFSDLSAVFVNDRS